jgi:hypothetical protein
LASGDRLLSVGGYQSIVAGLIGGSERDAKAYNLTTTATHTYYVLAGDTPVLVHNTGCGRIPWVTGKLPAAEEAALYDTLAHIDAGTVPTGPTAAKW